MLPAEAALLDGGAAAAELHQPEGGGEGGHRLHHKRDLQLPV